MKQILIISGKGGTGKTTLSAYFAILAKKTVIADCDVDAANMHLILKPTVKKTEQFISGKTALIDPSLCNKCGRCVEACQFDAIESFKINDIECEGCAFCYHVCPTGAISMNENLCGHWYVSDTSCGTMVHAKLLPGAENSGRLVTQVRNTAKEIAETQNVEYLIIDGPPGTGCPVIASISGVDAVMVVTEPTVSGMHDLKRIVELTNHFGIKTFVCVNKYDINTDMSDKIEAFSEKTNNLFIGRISFDKTIVDALICGKSIFDYPDNKTALEIKTIWNSFINKI